MGPRFFDGLGADPVLGTLASMAGATDDDEAWMRARAAAADARAPVRPDAGLRHQDAALRLGWPTLRDLGAIEVPTLVLHGAADLVLPTAHAEAIAAGVPGAQLRVIDGMGHIPTRREWAHLADLVATHVAVPRAGRSNQP